MREADRLRAIKVDTLAEQIHGTKARRFARYTRVAPGSYAERLLQAGVTVSPEGYVAFVFVMSLLAGFASFRIGPLASLCFGAAVWYYFLIIYLEERAAKRRRKVIPQLPSFIDGLTSALATGFNIDAAFIHAAEGVPPGLLRQELDRVVIGMEKGLTLDDAFSILKHRLQGQEIVSLAVAVSLFYGMGGRVLEPFRRLAKKVREQQAVAARANRDLVQVKLAFRIIFFVAWGAPMVLLIVEPQYLQGAFGDGFGRWLLQIAIGMQVAAYLLFKRVTTLRI